MGVRKVSCLSRIRGGDHQTFAVGNRGEVVLLHVFGLHVKATPHPVDALLAFLIEYVDPISLLSSLSASPVSLKVATSISKRAKRSYSLWAFRDFDVRQRTFGPCSDSQGFKSNSMTV